jgi:CheY-like chemotaxis protein
MACNCLEQILRILFVEDDAMNRRVVCDMLQVLGLDMQAAEDAPSGLDRLAKEHFDLVLMDIRMPGMDGLTATRQLRAGGGENALVPVIVVTADVSTDVFDRSRMAGANDVVLKPVSMNDLMAAIAKVSGDTMGSSVTLD